MRKLIVVAAIAAALGSAITVQAVGMSTDEQTLRSRLLACAILEEASERGISSRRLPITSHYCQIVR